MKRLTCKEFDALGLICAGGNGGDMYARERITIWAHPDRRDVIVAETRQPYDDNGDIDRDKPCEHYLRLDGEAS